MDSSEITDPLTSTDPLSNSIVSHADETPKQQPEEEIPVDQSNNEATSVAFALDPNEPPEEPKVSFCCDLDRTLTTMPKTLFLPTVSVAITDLREQIKPAITIEDANKVHDMAGKSFIAYLIRVDIDNLRFESKHRYSEFESLRNLLVHNYPSVAVPPIPEKHSVVAYAAKPGKAQQDPKIILKRKRLLQSFLNRVASHPKLQGCHEFHLFLKGETPWSDIVNMSGPVIRRKPSMAALVETKILKKPDPTFVAAEDYTVRFSNQITFIRKIHKKIVGYYVETAVSSMDLGALYNGWSLTEQSLSEAIEQMGQAVDSTLTATNTLHSVLDERFGDCLSEYIKYSSAIQSLLQTRHKAHLEFEQISESLINKQQQLQKLESTEHESQRLAAVLAVEGQPPIPLPRPQGFMAQLNALIDNDPEATRRGSISKTKDLIVSLEAQRETIRLQLLDLNSKIHHDLDRFQRQKVSDLRDMFVSVCLVHRDYHRKALEAWRATKEVVEKINT
ncbi:Sorting nexin, cytoplasm-to-vacuole targeting pathway/endosomal sorting [Boothiomyces macroporosus]|uniref:Sorting nexin, cytoplasm-to-vacuole targeting pathway/endosomal sorting n=1 Tax=Boothiomyces macroporosus TaxID=261099 RepID=A0AAD5Y5U3_9FUNG|nr:Sorting nexin, cytoplasm-to-vacuole targeting pathway/endosomal sorting [Boothiomyces macroporosus]